MRNVHYAGVSLETGDLIAERLLSSIPVGSGYAVVTFPARLADGTVDDVRLVLSAGTQLVSHPSELSVPDRQMERLDGVELADAAFEWFPLASALPVQPASVAAGSRSDEFDYDFEELF